MQLRKQLLFKLSLSLMVMSVMVMSAFFMSGSAKAQSCTPVAPATTCTVTTTGSTGVNGGALSATDNPVTINGGNPVTLTGLDQQIPLTFVTNVSDLRGTGAGWRVSGDSTGVPVTLVGNPTPVNEPINLTGAGVTAACHPAATCTSPAALTLTATGAITPGPLQLVSAPINQGIGTFDVTTNAQFLVPFNTAAGGTLTATVNLTLSNAP